MVKPILSLAMIVPILLLAVVLMAVGLVLVPLLWIAAVPAWIVARVTRRQAPPEEPPDVGEPDPPIDLERLLGTENRERWVDGVFEGGGAKAIAQIGAARAVERLGLRWSLLGGTSGGAIVASLLAAGKSSAEIWEILTGNDLSRLVDVKYLPGLRCFRKWYYLVLPLLPHLVLRKGLIEGGEFLKVMREKLASDGGDLTFGDLHNPGAAADPKAQAYRLRVVATDISRGTPVILPDDLPWYWEPWELARQMTGRDAGQLTPQDVRDCWPVAHAVRMSMAIPFVFTPYRLHLNQKDGQQRADEMGQKGKKVLIVDGGISSNFPIWLFDRLDKSPRWPTFGFLLDEAKRAAGERSQPVAGIGGLLDMAMAVIGTGMGALDKRLSGHDEYRTARLRTLRVSTSAFGLGLDRQKELYECGFKDANDRLRRFSWAEYIAEFRR